MILIAMKPSPNLNDILVLLIAFYIMIKNYCVVRLTRISKIRVNCITGNYVFQ